MKNIVFCAVAFGFLASTAQADSYTLDCSTTSPEGPILIEEMPEMWSIDTVKGHISPTIGVHPPYIIEPTNYRDTLFGVFITPARNVMIFDLNTSTYEVKISTLVSPVFKQNYERSGERKLPNVISVTQQCNVVPYREVDVNRLAAPHAPAPETAPPQSPTSH